MTEIARNILIGETAQRILGAEQDGAGQKQPAAPVAQTVNTARNNRKRTNP